MISMQLGRRSEEKWQIIRIVSGVRKTKYIEITKLVTIGILVIEIILAVKSLRNIKKEDPLMRIKRDLLVQRILIYVLVIATILTRTTIFLWL